MTRSTHSLQALFIIAIVATASLIGCDPALQDVDEGERALHHVPPQALPGPALMEFTGPAADDLATMADDAPEGWGYANYAVGAATATSAMAGLTAAAALPTYALVTCYEGEEDVVDDFTTIYTNSVEIDGVTVEGVLTQTCVFGICEATLDVTSSDGQLTDARFMEGFFVGALYGDWDVLDPRDGTIAQEYSWTFADLDSYEVRLVNHVRRPFDIAIVIAPDHMAVTCEDDAGDETSVLFEADGSGSVTLPAYNGGDPACWDTDRLNSDC